MRSRSVIAGDELQEDFDRLAAGWRAEYEPEGQAGESLIERVILGDWFLRRAERVCMEAEAELAAVHPLDWTEEQHKQMQLYSRYKTTAERSFYRAFYAVRGLRKDKLKEELDIARVRKQMEQCAREILKEAGEEAKIQSKSTSKTKGAIEARLGHAQLQASQGAVVREAKKEIRVGRGPVRACRAGGSPGDAQGT